MLDYLLSPSACFWYFAIGVPLLGVMGVGGTAVRAHNEARDKEAAYSKWLRFRLPDRNTFRPATNAAHCAAFAVAAYSQNGREREWLRRWCREQGHLYREWQQGNAEGVLVVAGDVTVLAIAGTNDRRDILHDGLVYSKRLGEFAADMGYDHLGGFAESRYPTGMLLHAAAVRRAMEARHPEIRAAKQLWVTGHSLGGATAELLPQIWFGFVPDRIVTFGAPRIRRRWSLSKEYLVERWQSIYDVVPKMPFVFYTHAAGETYHVFGKSYWTKHLGWIEGVIGSVWPLLRRLGLVEGHSMRRYYDYLEEQAAK